MYLVQNLLPHKGTTILYGPPGNAKTLLTAELVRGLLTSREQDRGAHKVFGHFPTANLGKRPNVVWVTGSQRSLDDAKDYLHTVGLGDDDNLHGPTGPIQLIGKDGAQGKKLVNAAKRKHDADLIVFDVLNEFTQRKPWEHPEIFHWFSGVAEDASVLILHHDNTKGGIFGGQAAISGAVQTTYRCEVRDDAEAPPGVDRYTEGIWENEIDRAVEVVDKFRWSIQDGHVRYEETHDPPSQVEMATNSLFNEVVSDGEMPVDKWLERAPYPHETAWQAFLRVLEKDGIVLDRGAAMLLHRDTMDHIEADVIEEPPDDLVEKMTDADL